MPKRDQTQAFWSLAISKYLFIALPRFEIISEWGINVLVEAELKNDSMRPYLAGYAGPPMYNMINMRRVTTCRYRKDYRFFLNYH